MSNEAVIEYLNSIRDSYQKAKGRAKTDRILASSSVSIGTKEALRLRYEALDPIELKLLMGIIRSEELKQAAFEPSSASFGAVSYYTRAVYTFLAARPRLESATPST